MLKIEIKEVYFHLEHTKKILDGGLLKTLISLSGNRYYKSYLEDNYIFLFRDDKIEKVEALLLKSNIPHRKIYEKSN